MYTYTHMRSAHDVICCTSTVIWDYCHTLVLFAAIRITLVLSHIYIYIYIYKYMCVFVYMFMCNVALKGPGMFIMIMCMPDVLRGVEQLSKQCRSPQTFPA